MFVEEIAMSRQFCLDQLTFNHFCQPSNSYATISISLFEHKGKFDFRVLLYLFNLFTLRVRCYPKFPVKINQRYRSDSGLITFHGRQEYMLKIYRGSSLFTVQNFFAIRHKQAFFSEIRPAGEIGTFLWKNIPTTRTSEDNL